MWYDNLNNKKLWSYFEEISQIPRESGNEEGIRKFLISFAKKNNIEAKTDKIGNVIFYKKATAGFEKAEPLLLQGHMDMVCVKTEESTHDFKKDGIKIINENGKLHALDTTLGGDNGIAVAMIMDIFTDDELKHGDLEALITTSEETGMFGAFGVEKEYFKSRKMLNLDSEEEGIIYIGCAGGIEVEANKKIREESVDKDFIQFNLKVNGLKGGHSGGEIHKQRANAIKIIARVLHRLDDYMLVSLDGGTKRNVIPSFASVVFCIDKNKKNIVENTIKNAFHEIKNEYKIQDPDINYNLEYNENCPKTAISKKLSKRWINALYLAHHGVFSQSLSIEGIVETSSNLAIVGIRNNKLFAISSVRSSVESAKNELSYIIASAFETAKAKIEYKGSYPAWEPDLKSGFTKTIAQKYKDFTKKKPVITAIHAGLECGIINSLIPNMESLSLGPDLFDVHSTKENLDIASCERILNFLKYFIATL